MMDFELGFTCFIYQFNPAICRVFYLLTADNVRNNKHVLLFPFILTRIKPTGARIT